MNSQELAIEYCNKAKKHAEKAIDYAIKCGEELIKIKAELKHGEFAIWIEANMPISYSMCRKYMQLYNNKNLIKMDNELSIWTITDALNHISKLKDEPKQIVKDGIVNNDSNRNSSSHLNKTESLPIENNDSNMSSSSYLNKTDRSCELRKALISFERTLIKIKEGDTITEDEALEIKICVQRLTLMFLVIKNKFSIDDEDYHKHEKIRY